MRKINTGLYEKVGYYKKGIYYYKYQEIKLNKKFVELSIKKFYDELLEKELILKNSNSPSLKKKVEALERRIETGKMLFKGMTFDEIYLEFGAKHVPQTIKKYIFYYLDKEK